MFKIVFLFFMSFLFSSVNSHSLDSPNFPEKEVLVSWNDWLLKTKNDIEQRDFKLETKKHIEQLNFIKRVIELDQKQPEFKLNFKQYITKVMPKQRILMGKKKYIKNKDLLLNIEDSYNVSRYLILALWGVETSYGKHTGNFDVLDSLATLSYEGRRAEFFYKEFIHSLEIIDKGFINRKNLRGSWAGAIGQTQFMPSTFINFAEDFDGDGKKDLLNNKDDALASGANYLNKLGWNNNLDWGERVYPNEKIQHLNDLSNNKVYKSQSYWKEVGFSLNKNYGNEKLRLVIPDNTSSYFFLVSKNFDIILNWNRSNYFALAVNILSDKIKLNEK